MRHLGEGDGTPLQYSCLENPMDGGAWWAAVHGVTKSRTRLSDFTFTFTFHFHALEKEMVTHSSVLAWRIPGTGPGGLPSMGSHRVRHDWSDLAAAEWSSNTFASCLEAMESWPSLPFVSESGHNWASVLELWPTDDINFYEKSAARERQGQFILQLE